MRKDKKQVSACYRNMNIFISVKKKSKSHTSVLKVQIVFLFKIHRETEVTELISKN